MLHPSVEMNDLFSATFKTLVFGLIIGLVRSFQGMRTSGGTESVGRSVTSSVVISSLFVILTDVVLVKLFIAIFGGEG
jgi:phospholipid/cholesterol/gamma-HCH transport system permease protein